jgi:hypothetical protein
MGPVWIARLIGVLVLARASSAVAQPTTQSEPATVAGPATQSDVTSEAEPTIRSGLDTRPALKNEPEAAAPQSLFYDAEDGYFDVSNFLSTRVGFLPIAMPITEPAVGYGLGLGLTFFHDKPKVVNYPGQPPRVIMPSMTVVFGAATESQTWAAGVGHIGVWDKGKIRYLGAAGYANLNLDWFGKGDSLGDSPVSYTNEVLFLYQKLTFKLGDSDFFLGPQYRLLSTDASFARDASNSGVQNAELESKTSGLGAVLAYDSLDQPFSATRGVRAEVTYSHQAEALGGDFDYGRLNYFGITYVPFGKKVVLGLRVDGGLITDGDAPFYDLPSLSIRGIPRGRYVDNAALLTEAELRYDLTNRWTLIAFGGVGRVAETFGDLGSADTHAAVGGGFRYLIARQYGMRMGVDLGYGDDGDWSIYVTMGTGWVRP